MNKQLAPKDRVQLSQTLGPLLSAQGLGCLSEWPKYYEEREQNHVDLGRQHDGNCKEIRIKWVYCSNKRSQG